MNNQNEVRELWARTWMNDAAWSSRFKLTKSAVKGQLQNLNTGSLRTRKSRAVFLFCLVVRNRLGFGCPYRAFLHRWWWRFVDDLWDKKQNVSTSWRSTTDLSKWFLKRTHGSASSVCNKIVTQQRGTVVFFISVSTIYKFSVLT